MDQPFAPFLPEPSGEAWSPADTLPPQPPIAYPGGPGDAFRPAQLDFRLQRPFRFVHEPLSGADKTLPWLGAETLKRQLQTRVLFSNGGAFLITGFRGVGKTTLVQTALKEIETRKDPAELVLPVYVSVARSTSTEHLLFTIVRHVFEELNRAKVLNRLSAETRQALLLSYMRTSLSFKQNQSEARDRSAGLDLGGGKGIARMLPKLSLSASRTQSLATEAAFLAYSETDVEYDLMHIVQMVRREPIGPPARSRLRQLWPWPHLSSARLRLVIVLDEVDKLTVDDSGLQAVEALLSGIKNVLTMSGAHFLIVAGPDLHDRAVRDAARGNGVYESVFGWRLYVPCSWQAPRQLLAWWLSLGNGPMTLDEVVFDLADYLQFKARGIPRRLLQEFNSFVTWDESGLPVLRLSQADLERVRFYARLERILQAYLARHGESRMFPVPIDDDRWRLGCYFVADWVLQSDGQPFSIAEVLGLNYDAQFDPLLRISRRNVEQLLDHLTGQGILEVVRESAANLDLGKTRFADVAEADAKVYRLVGDVRRALFGFAARNETERAGLDISLIGPPVTAPPAAPAPREPAATSASVFPSADQLAGEPAVAMPHRLLNGRYELRELLGQGGMGTVWAGEDRITGRHVAVKIMRASMHGDAKALARVRREAEINSKLMHPQIVQTYDVVQDPDGDPALVMEFLEGPTLSALVERDGPQAPGRTAAIGRVLADALAYLEAAGVYRVDLKPSNIIMHPERGPVIIDLGVARAMESSVAVTTVQRMIGTPLYMAPEVIKDQPADARSDQYALGLVMYFCLTGESPFGSANNLASLMHAILYDTIQLSGLAISPSLRNVLTRMLAREPEQRFASAAEVSVAIGQTSEWQSGGTADSSVSSTVAADPAR